MSRRTYAIIGTGAIGGYYGAKLQQAGNKVHFLARGDYQAISERGLEVRSPDGDIHLKNVSVFNDASKMPKCDAALVCLKATQNDVLGDILPRVLKDKGVAIMMQNGYGVENIAARIVGPDRVMGALCFICCNKIAPGVIEHQAYGRIKLAEYRADGFPAGISPRMEEFKNHFEIADLDVEMEDDLMLARWQKLVWNIPFNGMSVVLRATTDQMLACQETRSTIENLMTEVVHAALDTTGRAIPEGFVQQMLENTDKMPPYKTSMLLDFEAGRPMEIEAMFGAPVRAEHDAKAEFRIPLIEMLYHQLLFLNGHKDETPMPKPPKPEEVAAIEEALAAKVEAHKQEEDSELVEPDLDF